MSSVDQFVAWQTYSGDWVKVYSTAERGDDGGLKIRWHWRRTHGVSGRILARSAEPKKRRKDAMWEAHRVNPKVIFPETVFTEASA